MVFIRKLEFKNKLLLIIFLSFIFCDFSYIDNNVKTFKNNENSILEEIIFFEKKYNHNLTYKVFNEFYSINNKNKLLDINNTFQKTVFPVISVIMTVYNQAHCLHKCLRSIQNQSIKNIEIIIVDDCSLDNSTETIKEYQKRDQRIIFIGHEANEGTIKARSDGFRISKGKYIS